MDRESGHIREDPRSTSVSYERFRWGAVPRALYRVMLVLLPVMLAFGWKVFLGWLALVVFCGFALRPFLVATGLYDGWLIAGNVTDHVLHGDLYRKKREAAEREQRRLKLKRQRAKDPGLPKNW